MRFGCQTYSWQMSYELHKDKLPNILDTIEQAGFSGVEAEVCMLGNYYEDPSLFAEALNQRNLQLAALTLAEPWLEMKETDEERENANKLIRFLSAFPQAKLILVQLPGKDRAALRQRQGTALSCVNAIASRASEAGIRSAYHPNSPGGSVFRTFEDYQVLFEGLDDRYIGYCPDSGHIAHGDMDPLTVFREQYERIVHVHFKDRAADKSWRMMGEGAIDHLAIVNLLRNRGYSGWVMIEEESQAAEVDPDTATMNNGHYVQGLKKEERRISSINQIQKGLK